MTKNKRRERELCGKTKGFGCVCAAASYCDEGIGKVSPAEQVNESVEAGQFTAVQLLSFHHGGGFCPVHVVDGSDHPQTLAMTR